ncbi:YjiH family protein [Viridibacillus sp. YIM B01967]|uniref:YjiH family protein n=1 Tax=Viridibacillus soli TaxID=2798301 RepID=A0ABS1H8G8_9BACL|nr:YjiH family protein [Viridibacillus soli]MBK3495706.1 YjiH family protein [Viridibacillus soli]
MKKFPVSTWLLFIIPSIIGVFLFMTPIKTADGWKVPIAILANLLAGSVVSFISWFTIFIFLIAALGSVAYQFIPQKDPKKPTMFDGIFRVNWFWTITRVLGFIFGLMVVMDFGPSAIRNEGTGGLLMNPDDGLVTFLFTIFLFAGLLLPFLTEFGLLEFFGTMMVKIMRPLFKIPGRSSIDALASWIGDGTIGVLLTNRQYEEGNYTQKEASIIATSFSIVSITFCIVVIDAVDLGRYFIPFYGSVVLCGLVLAFIMPRIYPLSKKKNTYINGQEIDLEREKLPKGYNMFTHGLENALKTAERNRKFSKFFVDGFKNVLDMWFGVAPIVMAFGTIALMLAEFTGVFTFLGKPFEPILTVLGLPEASEAAQTMVVGFADMFLPTIIGAGIESDLTRFVIAGVSVSQLIYMSEVGGLILGTKIPLNFFELIIIFLLRTLISLPIIAGIGHLIF